MVTSQKIDLWFSFIIITHEPLQLNKINSRCTCGFNDTHASDTFCYMIFQDGTGDSLFSLMYIKCMTLVGGTGVHLKFEMLWCSNQTCYNMLHKILQHERGDKVCFQLCHISTNQKIPLWRDSPDSPYRHSRPLMWKAPVARWTTVPVTEFRMNSSSFDAKP